MEKSENIVMEWLKSLSLSQHGSSFIDNGYDDLEICKKIGDQDLDAIGVLNVCERLRILDAVNSLKLNGGTSVYLAIEEHMKRNKCNSPAGSDKIRNSSRPSSMSSEERCCSSSNKEILQESTCGRIPSPKLHRLIKDKLRQDGIKLFNPPYSSVNGDRGYLEGLASHYADDLKTFYSDVLSVLEEIRVEEWKNMSPRMMVLQDGVSSVPILPSTGISSSSQGVTSASQISLLETPQTIYAPGKYSPSSCLSHCEEDVIYGFGGEKKNSAACMFPFGEKASTAHKKKSGGISKLLRTLRVRREKSPRHMCQPHTRQGRKTISQNCKTMTVVYPRPALLTADPKTQRRRVLQMARDGELSLEEAMAWLRISRIEESRSSGIYCNTKDQTVKYLKYSARSHSQSPAHTHGSSVNAQTCCCQVPGFSSQACEAVVHWYDEPSYENQDEYFLRRNCLKNNDSCEAISPCCTQESDVISLPSAGDIALGRHGQVYTRESPIGSSGRISSEELLCSKDLAGFGTKDKCCNMQQWSRNCWDSGDYIRQRSVRDSGDYAGSDSRSLSISSLEDPPSSHVIGRCRALIDMPQDSSDPTLLSFKKGEAIDILSTRPDGLWVGRTGQGTGNLIASTVEVLNVSSRSGVASAPCCTLRHCFPLNEQGGTFSAIKNVLKTFGCEEYLALLISNGYDDLEALRNLELSDLDLLGIRDHQSRANLLLVVRYLHQAMEAQSRPVFVESRQSFRTNFPVGCATTYREPKDSAATGSARAKRPTFLQQYNIPVTQRCCGQDYVNGELCSSANPDASTLLGQLQLADNASRDPPRDEERDNFGDFGKRYGSEKSSDSGISVRSRSPVVQSPGQKPDGVFSSKRFIKQSSHQNLMS